MDDRARTLMREGVSPAWDERRHQRLLARTTAALAASRRTRARCAFAVASVLVVIVCVVGPFRLAAAAAGLARVALDRLGLGESAIEMPAAIGTSVHEPARVSRPDAPSTSGSSASAPATAPEPVSAEVEAIAVAISELPTATPPRGEAKPNVPTVDDLLDRSDEARRQGDAETASKLLTRVVNEHPRDPRAALAAFTLGRVLLEDLGRPDRAAAAFAKSRALGPSSAVAEDALARQVEATARAGRNEAARALAADYAERYPKGVHAARVRRFGAVD